jgi:Fe-S cluster biosynthesis and repair protein YggX
MSHSNTSEGGSQGPRRVLCVKLGRELQGLPYKPFPSELGQRIYDQVSQEAWSQWIEQSKMLVNENRLNLSLPESRAYLMEQCEKFLFGPGTAPPPDYVPKG